MKTVTITKSIIDQALAGVVSFTDQKDESASCVFISVMNEKMAIEATNYSESIRSKFIPCKGEDVDRSAIDGKRLLQVIKAMASDEITLTFGSDELIVKQGRTRFKIRIMTTNSIKEISFPKGDEISLNGEVLMGMERIVHAIDANNPNHNFCGLQMELLKKTVVLVGTDSKRLAAVKYPLEYTCEDKSFLLPKRSVLSMVKLFGGNNITAFADDVNFTIVTDSLSYSTRTINGQFPDWQKIMKANRPSIAHSIVIDTTSLAALAIQAGIINEEAEIIIKNGELTMNAENAKSQQSMEAGFAVGYEANDEISFGVNIRFLVDYITAANTDTLTLNYISTTSPFFLESNSFIEILMPIVLTQSVSVGEAA